ncbi:HEAT repeat domain-containing protein [bacterium AH-315-M10]|nr:HEAT repeat domain-containing protein [bacterium AH-315-M10]
MSKSSARLIALGLLVLLAACKSNAHYAEQLKSSDPLERQEALLHFSSQEKVDDLTVEILRASIAGGEPSPLVRAAAAYALGELGDTENVPLLIKSLKDKNHLVRFDAVIALGKLGDGRAVKPLIDRLSNDAHPWVRLKSARALRKLKAGAAVPSLVSALDDRSRSVQYNAHQALRELTGQKFSRDQSEWEAWLIKRGLGKQ